MGLVGAEGAAVVERRGAGDVRPHAAARAHPGDRSVARGEEAIHDRSPPRRSASLFPRRRGGQRRRQWTAHVRPARRPGDDCMWFRPEIIKTVNWGGDPTKPVDAEARRAPAAPPFVRALAGGGATATRVRGRASDLEAADELAAPRHRSRPRAAALQRAARRACARRGARGRVPRPEEPAVRDPCSEPTHVRSHFRRRRAASRRRRRAGSASGDRPRA